LCVDGPCHVVPRVAACDSRSEYLKFSLHFRENEDKSLAAMA
jgi:hypothetical protein